ncbi:ACP phosphodiesterase [Ancylomarina longa]|uniref:DUF479 domain-containing protein n=1 Tax=Ancylomarina longa TaxID=2487017 RepID=A0A434AXY8_9BACT|nr:ACP phosphodiesterase [Ancylomarina longa]RUT79301.1 DUF479 domain-containing protein [Ancylomarina longa]
MNFLAHLYLSGDSEKIKIGNFIGDYVKGKKYQNYPKEIQKGILLHRSIDAFTDKHPMVLKSANRLKKGYQRYGGVVVDIFYDHFLAKYWDQFHPIAMSKFVNNTHEILIRNYLKLPKEVKFFLPFLIKSRRLESYADLEGVSTALDIMARRTSLPDQSGFAMQILADYYQEFEAEFRSFMPDILGHISQNHNISVTTPNDWHLNEGR